LHIPYRFQGFRNMKRVCAGERRNQDMAESTFHTSVLNNGLKVVFESIPALGSAAVGFLVRTGSRDEPRERAGMSHFLEHMCFKGTYRRTWEEINREVDTLGALWNAFTWWEGTAYYHWVQARRVDDSVDILSDMMRPRLDMDDFTTEKQVILEEISMYNDNPSALIVDRLIQRAFGDHPLGVSVLGTLESVGAVEHSDMSAYFRRRYNPNNMVFLASGSLDGDRLLETVARCTASWFPGDGGRRQSAPAFCPGARWFVRPEITREHLAMAWPGPPIGSDWEITARVLARYFGDRENSRLYWAVKQKGLVDQVSASHYGFTDAGFLYVYASCAPSKAREVLNLIRGELAELHGNVHEAALGRARIKAESSLAREAEHGLYRWMQLAERESAGIPPENVLETTRRIQAVTPERVGEFLKVFPLNGDPVLVGVGPLEGLD